MGALSVVNKLKLDEDEVTIHLSKKSANNCLKSYLFITYIETDLFEWLCSYKKPKLFNFSQMEQPGLTIAAGPNFAAKGCWVTGIGISSSTYISVGRT
jgi:hypothetical protein